MSDIIRRPRDQLGRHRDAPPTALFIVFTAPERDFERDERVFAQVLRSVRITPWLNWWARLPGLPLMCNWEQRVPAHLAIVGVRLHAG